MILMELARRLCEAAHPHFHTTGATVPCGQHIAEARAYMPLLTVEGVSALETIVGVAVQDRNLVMRAPYLYRLRASLDLENIAIREDDRHGDELGALDRVPSL